MNKENQQTSRYNYLNNLIAKYSIVELINNYVKLTKKGQNYCGLCPFHNDKNPSMWVSPQKNIFKCFACNSKGNAINFIMMFKKIPLGLAVKEFKTIFNIEDKNLDYYTNINNIDQKAIELYEINQKAVFYFHHTLLKPENTQIIDYLKKRKIDQKLINFYEIGYAPKSIYKNYLINLFSNSNKDINPNQINYLLLDAGLVNVDENGKFTDFFIDRLMIPIKDENGNFVGFSGRSLDKNIQAKYLNTKTTHVFQKENLLFNFFAVDKTNIEELFIVEGYMDVFAFKRIGIDNVVATMGTAFTNNHLNILKRYNNIKRIILCFDNDTAGNLATIATANKLIANHYDVFFIKPFEKQYKDIDELTNKLDNESVKKIINNQVGFISYHISFLKNLNLSYKDKKIELTKLIDMLNTFAYQEVFFTEDKKLISEFFEIDVEELLNLITVRKNRNLKNYQKQNNNYQSPKSMFDFNNQPWNYLKQDVIEQNRLYSSNNNSINENIFNWKNEMLKKQEIDIIFNLMFNKQIALLYIKHINFICRNNLTTGLINKILNVILLTVNQFINNNYEYEPKKIIATIKSSNQLTDIELRYFDNLLKQTTKYLSLPNINHNNYENPLKQTNEYKIFNQCISIIKSIKDEQYLQGLQQLRNNKEFAKLKKDNQKLETINKQIIAYQKERDLFLEDINNIKYEKLLD